MNTIHFNIPLSRIYCAVMENETQSVQFLMRMTPSLRAILREVAQHKGLTDSDVVREAILREAEEISEPVEAA